MTQTRSGKRDRGAARLDSNVQSKKKAAKVEPAHAAEKPPQQVPRRTRASPRKSSTAEAGKALEASDDGDSAPNTNRAHVETEGTSTGGGNNTLPDQEPSPKQEPLSDAESTGTNGTEGSMMADVDPSSLQGASYEQLRRERIRRNRELMASLGLNNIKSDMSASVAAHQQAEKTARIRARGLKAEKAPPEPAGPPRRSQRIQKLDAPVDYYEDPEAAFVRRNPMYKTTGMFGKPSEYERPPPRPTRHIPDPINFSAKNSMTDDDSSATLRKLMSRLSKSCNKTRTGKGGGGGGSAGGRSGGRQMTSADECVSRLRKLTITEETVSKVVKERAYCLEWHPSADKLIMAVGDKVGHVGIWCLDPEEGMGQDGVFLFQPHLGAVPRIQYSPTDSTKMYTTSYDGTIRCLDLNEGTFDQVYANDEADDITFNHSHIPEDTQLMYISDSVGQVTCLDLRTNTEAWSRAFHNKKVNTVHTHPLRPELLVTAGLDRSVALWDVRALREDPDTKTLKSLAVATQGLSVNCAYFSPTGEWISSVGQDNKIHLYKDPSCASKTMKADHSVHHNNQTGRWLTKFHSCWDPKSRDVFGIGSMEQPRRMQAYSATSMSPIVEWQDDIMASVQSVVVFHPTVDAVGGINSSGRAHVWR